MKAKIGVLLLASVIASAGMGISYASINGIPMSDGFNDNGSNGDHIGICAVDMGDPGFDQVHVQGNTYQSDKNVAGTDFVNNGDPSWYMMDIDGKSVGFYNETYPSPSLTIDNAYPCYASSITFWFGNHGGTVAYIDGVDIQEVSGLVIDDWELKIDGSQVASGIGKTNLISALEDNSIVVLNSGQYLSVYIEFHFDNTLPENIPEELFEYSFVWWGPPPD